MKRAFITGVNGFVGSYLVSELKDAGYEVIGSGREATATVAGLKSYHELDVVNKEAVAKIISLEKPTHIYHLAGIASPTVAEKNKDLTFAVHVNGTENILRACLELDTAPKILVVSSGNIYGVPEYLPMDEKHPLNGKGVYAESRIAQEQMVARYIEKLPIIITRSFNHTGPGQPADYVFPRMVKSVVEIARGLRQEVVMGNPNLKRECLHVSDVVRAYRLLLEQDKTGLAVNVCRGESVVLKDAIEYSRVLAGLTNVILTLDPAFAGKKEIEEITGDPSLLKTLISWNPKSLEIIVQDLYKYWQGELNEHV